MSEFKSDTDEDDFFSAINDFFRLGYCTLNFLKIFIKELCYRKSLVKACF